MRKHLLLKLLFVCFVLTSPSVKAGNGGYLFAHMRHEDYGRLYYYISRDTKNWTKLNNNERVVPEYRGHPDIMKGRDGRYYMIGVSEKTQNPILWTSINFCTSSSVNARISCSVISVIPFILLAFKMCSRPRSDGLLAVAF